MAAMMATKAKMASNPGVRPIFELGALPVSDLDVDLADLVPEVFCPAAGLVCIWLLPAVWETF